jgi:hypothetical protein
MKKNTHKCQPEASAPENPSTHRAANDADHAAPRTTTLPDAVRLYVPSWFNETKTILCPLEAGEHRAHQHLLLADPRFDASGARKPAAPEEYAPFLQLSEPSKLNAYPRVQGQAKLPPAELGKGYVALRSADSFSVLKSDAPEQLLLSL